MLLLFLFLLMTDRRLLKPPNLLKLCLEIANTFCFACRLERRTTKLFVHLRQLARGRAKPGRPSTSKKSVCGWTRGFMVMVYFLVFLFLLVFFFVPGLFPPAAAPYHHQQTELWYACLLETLFHSMHFEATILRG